MEHRKIDDKSMTNWKTTEFRTSVFVLAGIFACQFLGMSAIPWTIAFAGIIGSYIISRGMFKKDRSVMLYQGYHTSEFYFLVAGIVIFCGECATGKINADCAFLGIGFIQFCYNLSRGQTKSFTPAPRQLMNL